MMLPLLLFVSAALPLAFVGLHVHSLYQAAATFLLAWVALTSWKAKVEEKARLGGLDPLTGLADAPAFTTRLRQEMARAARFGRGGAVILLALQRSEGLDKKHGAGAAREALRQAAQTLRHVTRSVDFLGRWDEASLALVLPEVELSEAGAAAEKLLNAVSRVRVRLPDGTRMGGVTVSLGLTGFGGRGETLARVMERAGAAVAAAGRKGRNKIAVLKG